MIGPAARGKDLAPAILGVAEDERNKFPGRIVRRAGVNRRSLARLLGWRTHAAEQVEDYARIDAEIPADQADDDDGADAETAPASWHPAGRARLAIIFDVAARTEIIGAHLCHSPIEFRWSCRRQLALSNSLSGNESQLMAKNRVRQIERAGRQGNGMQWNCGPATVRRANRAGRHRQAGRCVVRLESLPASPPAPATPTAADKPQQ